jgi:hypothetical protein
MERTADRRCAKKGIIRLKIERFRHRCNAVHADTIRSLVGDGDFHNALYHEEVAEML